MTHLLLLIYEYCLHTRVGNSDSFRISSINRCLLFSVHHGEFITHETFNNKFFLVAIVVVRLARCVERPSRIIFRSVNNVFVRVVHENVRVIFPDRFYKRELTIIRLGIEQKLPFAVKIGL